MNQILLKSFNTIFYICIHDLDFLQAMLESEYLAEAACVGIPDELKGEVPLGLCVLKHGNKTKNYMSVPCYPIVTYPEYVIASFAHSALLRSRLLLLEHNGKCFENKIVSLSTYPIFFLLVAGNKTYFFLPKTVLTI